LSDQRPAPCIARPPTGRGRDVPSGAMPTRTNGNASLAPAQTKRKSQGSCRPVMPTPAAWPFTAAMVSLRQRKMASVTLPPASLCAE
jgi:hypothetical protein